MEEQEYMEERGEERRCVGREHGVKSMSLLRRSAKAAGASVKRYPRHVIESVRDSRKPTARVMPCVDLAGFEEHELAAVWIGHATVLLRVGGLNVLTDPVFSSRIGVNLAGMTIGVPRLRAPAMDVEHVPAIDVVLLSHAHFDHLDRPSLERLAAGPARGATIVTAARTRGLIPPGFGRVIELPWDRRVRVGGLRVGAMKPAHWGARAGLDHFRGFNAYTLEHGGRRVLFAGDTAATNAFERVGPMDLSIFGIGAYDPWEHAHATPEQVWRMFTGQSQGCGGGKGALLPMHHSTFALGREPVDEPLRRLRTAAGESGAPGIVGTEPGMIWHG